jgi:hypothetical protein
MRHVPPSGVFLSDAVPQGSLVAGRVVDLGDVVGEQSRRPVGGGVGRPAWCAGGDGFERRRRQNGAVDRWCERKQAQRAADLPYVLVRIMESYVYLSLITGDEPDAARASRVIHALLPAR